MTDDPIPTTTADPLVTPVTGLTENHGHAGRTEQQQRGTIEDDIPQPAVADDGAEEDQDDTGADPLEKDIEEESEEVSLPGQDRTDISV